MRTRVRLRRSNMQRELGKPPPASSEAVSRSMKANVAKNTSPERLLQSALYASGIRGYRLHLKGVTGRPDIAFPKSKLAVFVNGCFWHRCPRCALPMPKTHPAFWSKKFELNVARDKRKVAELEAAGWRVMTVWEHEIRREVAVVVQRIKRAL